MKHHLAIITTLLIVLFATPAIAANEKPATAFPDSWYILPEDAGASRTSREDLAQFSASDLDPKAAKASLNHTFDVNNRVLERIVTDSNFASTEQAAANPWHLAFFGLDIGMSASGVAGVLFAKGEATASLIWKRLMSDKAFERPEQNKTDPDADASDFSVRGDMTTAEIKAALEPIISSVLASGQINSEKTLRNNLFLAAKEFVDMTHAIALDPTLRWTAVRMRFDLSIDGSGMVQPGLSVGGGIKIRFDWFPSESNFRSAAAKEASNQPSMASTDSIGDLLGNLAHELQLVQVDSSTSPAGLRLNTINFSLGIFANGKFGVAKGSTSAIGMIYFKQNPHFDASRDTDLKLWSQATIPVVESRPPTTHIQYAKAIGVNTLVEHDSRGGMTQAIYMVPHEALQIGMQKSLLMGGALADQASQHQSTNWRLDQLRVQFALSLGGTTGLITVGATAAMQLAYQAPQTNAALTPTIK